MGTYYTLGIVKDFTARSRDVLSEIEMKEALNERFDLAQYEIEVVDDVTKGVLKENLFEENIEDFYATLVSITGNERVLEWFDLFKTNIDKYYMIGNTIDIRHEGNQITIDCVFAMLFIEGKVIAEEFKNEPKILNWLFRRANLPNKLAGCVMSCITR